MKSTSETGHAKNVANFKKLIIFCQGYGARYNPSNSDLQLPQLQPLVTTAQDSLKLVTKTNTTFNNAVNDRVNVYVDLKPLATRLMNALQTTKASDEKVDDARGFNRKLQGGRASKIKKIEDPNEPAPNTISASQQSFVMLNQHFQNLVSVLESESTYAPNETDLQMETLNAKIEALENTNEAVANAYTDVSNARVDRQKKLYTNENSLVDIALEIKKYVKSVFGATSPEFKQVDAIAFRKIKQ